GGFYLRGIHTAIAHTKSLQRNEMDQQTLDEQPQEEQAHCNSMSKVSSAGARTRARNHPTRVRAAAPRSRCSHFSLNSIGASRYRSFFQTLNSWPPESTCQTCGIFFSSSDSWSRLLPSIRLSVSPQETQSSRSCLGSLIWSAVPPPRTG